MGTVSWIGLQIQCSIQIHCFKNIQTDMTYVFKIRNCIGQLGLCWMSPSKAQGNEVERTATMNDIVLFRSPAT